MSRRSAPIAAWLMKVSEPRANAPPKLPNIGR